MCGAVCVCFLLFLARSLCVCVCVCVCVYVNADFPPSPLPPPHPPPLSARGKAVTTHGQVDFSRPSSTSSRGGSSESGSVGGGEGGRGGKAAFGNGFVFHRDRPRVPEVKAEDLPRVLNDEQRKELEEREARVAALEAKRVSQRDIIARQVMFYFNGFKRCKPCAYQCDKPILSFARGVR